MIGDVDQARELALDQIEAAALRGDRERIRYWVDQLVDRLLERELTTIRLRIEAEHDPFALVEELKDLKRLPTIGQWLKAGGPVREIDSRIIVVENES